MELLFEKGSGAGGQGSGLKARISGQRLGSGWNQGQRVGRTVLTGQKEDGPQGKHKGGVRCQGQEVAVRSQGRVGEGVRGCVRWQRSASWVRITGKGQGPAHLAVTLSIRLVAVGVKALVNVTVARATCRAPPPAPWALLVHPGVKNQVRCLRHSSGTLPNPLQLFPSPQPPAPYLCSQWCPK